MKKIIVIAAAFMSCIAANAQGLWVSAGYTGPKQTATTEIGSTTSKSSENLGGFFVGAEYEMSLSDLLGIAVGLNADFESKKEHDIKQTRIGFDIPVLARVGFDLTSDFRAFVNAGPDVYFGAVNKQHNEDLDLTVDIFEDADLSRLGIGAVVGAGVDFASKYRFFVNYNFGLNDMEKDSDAFKFKVNTLKVGFAYKF